LRKTSAIFGKKDYHSSLEQLVASSDFKGALEEAISIGDNSYELGHTDEAINIFENLLDIFATHSMTNPQILIKLYEKLSPLYFEVNKVTKGVDAALTVVKNKLALKETGEAIQILKILEVQFLSNSNLMKKIIEIYVSLGFFSNALKLVERIVQGESKPDIEILHLGGELSYKLGRMEDALGYFNAVLILNPIDEVAEEKISEISSNIHSGSKDTLKNEDEINTNTGKETAPQIINEPPAGIEAKPEPQAQSSKPLKISVEDKNPKNQIETEEAYEKNVALETISEKMSEATYAQKGFSAKDLGELAKNGLYIQALEEIKLGQLKQGINLLTGLAQTFEPTDLFSAEFLYNKIFLLDPTNVKIPFKLSELYKSCKDINEAVFYLRVASKNALGEEKLSTLKELMSLIPNDVDLTSEIFEAFTQLRKIDDAITLLEKTSEKELLESFATRLIPYVREDSSALMKIARILKKNNISGSVYYQYAYLAYKSLFASRKQPEAIKWFISAHRINKLPLDDYIEVANYIKDIPLDDEKSIVAEAIFGYLNTIEDIEKKSRLIELVINLKPEKPTYIAKYLELLLETSKYKESPNTILKLVNTNSFDYALLVYDATTKVSDALDTDTILKIAQFLELAGKKDEASSLYQMILVKDPTNAVALIKSLIGKVESESLLDLLKLMDNVAPSHTFADFLASIVERYKNDQVKNPFDYHSHFALGFIYFFTERYEEAIASFQFVVRSHHYESFMHLLLGIAFERILLEDFGSKQYEIGLNLEKEKTPTRLALLYRIASLKKSQGDVSDSRKYLEELVSLAPDYKDAKQLLLGIGNGDKIIGLNEEEGK
jgi:tetratricopeptide (TPR) repeat protein